MNQAYTVPTSTVIAYEPEAMRDFFVYGFEWIDNLHFLQSPEKFVGVRAHTYVSAAKERFIEFGWAGDGEVDLLWLPSFVFPLQLRIPPEGVAVWHVKQEEDGVSYLLSPIELPFPEFSAAQQ
jgi:hypothetical protein